MTIDFQTWMRAVWTSIVEPTESARKALAMDIPAQALWTGLALVAVLNVMLVALLQVISPMPQAMQEQGFALSPFGFFGIIGIFFVLFVYGIFYAGRMIGGQGTLQATLTIVVWFQAVSLTLEGMQFVLVLISPAIGSIFGLLTLGALIWCFMNFINVLHGFNNLGKALGAIVLALIGTALVSGIILAVLGASPTGGMA
ncbi:Yip1 domain-containing protein [Yoonia rosea]|uniref:Yip1 domain-containing protein n=1 Tax=Yoonia rosea TaxID=287098 RepID=A0A1R3WN24_9RHOB|nr:YIP1 family protein [Yoonia rosea]SIT79317.1 Yip1 domain-containing protein [Yoonia rosea]